MAQADPELRKPPNLRYFIGLGDLRTIMGRDQIGTSRFVPKMPLDVAIKDSNRRLYEPITGRLHVGFYIVAVCYTTAVILLGWWAWNFLLFLLLFPIRNKRVRFCAFPTTRSNGPVQPKASCTRGSSL